MHILRYLHIIGLFVLFPFSAQTVCGQALPLTKIEKDSVEMLQKQIMSWENSEKHLQTAQAYEYIANVYKNRQLRGLAIQYYKKVVEHGEKADEKNMVYTAYKRMGTVFSELEQYDNALGAFLASLKFKTNTRDKELYLNELFSIAHLQQIVNKHQQAIETLYIIENIILFQVYSEKHIIQCYDDLAVSYKAIGNNDEYLKYKQIAERRRASISQMSQQNGQDSEQLKTAVRRELEQEQEMRLKQFEDSLLAVEKRKREVLLRDQMNNLIIREKENMERYTQKINDYMFYGAISAGAILLIFIVLAIIIVRMHLKIKRLKSTSKPQTAQEVDVG